MRRLLGLLPFVVLGCCNDAEKVMVPPLPLDGAAIPYDQVLTRLTVQTDAAKDEHFQNRWDGLTETANALELTAGYLPRATNVPESAKPRLEKDRTDLSTSIVRLRDAAKVKDESTSLEMIRRIHNRVRELRLLK